MTHCNVAATGRPASGSSKPRMEVNMSSRSSMLTCGQGTCVREGEAGTACCAHLVRVLSDTSESNREQRRVRAVLHHARIRHENVLENLRLRACHHRVHASNAHNVGLLAMSGGHSQLPAVRGRAHPHLDAPTIATLTRGLRQLARHGVKGGLLLLLPPVHRRLQSSAIQLQVEPALKHSFAQCGRMAMGGRVGLGVVPR